MGYIMQFGHLFDRVIFMVIWAAFGYQFMKKLSTLVRHAWFQASAGLDAD